MKNFTLSEVLICLVVIGIISITIVPIIIQRYDEKVTIAKVKNAYFILSEAYSKAITENGGGLEEWKCFNRNTGGILGGKCIMDELSKHLNIINKSSKGKDNIPYSLNKQDNTINNYTKMTSFKLSNGFIIKISEHSAGCYTYEKWKDIDSIERFSCQIFVDINGEKGPNALGRDVFGFKIHNTKIAGLGNTTEPYYTFQRMCNISKTNDIWDGNTNGSACTAWILENDNMDYLHCSNLSWTGKRKCN